MQQITSDMWLVMRSSSATQVQQTTGVLACRLTRRCESQYRQLDKAQKYLPVWVCLTGAHGSNTAAREHAAQREVQTALAHLQHACTQPKQYR